MDQIADLLTRIKNASLVKKYEIIISHSKMKEAILTILKKESFIRDFEMFNDNSHKMIRAWISSSHTPTHLKQISKPGRKVYAKHNDIPSPLRGMGLVIISTPVGMTTGRDAKKKGVGGELICEIW